VLLHTTIPGIGKFKSETPVNMYALLPVWWQGTLPEQKEKIVGVINKHKGFMPECAVRSKLKSLCSIPVVDQQIVSVCNKMAKQHPEHLEMVGVPSDDSVDVTENHADIRAAYKEQMAYACICCCEGS
jgi:hypothetical protein